MKEWRTLVQMEMNECNMAVFAQPSHALVDYHQKRSGKPLHDAVWVNCKNSATTENQATVAWYMG